MTQMKIKKDINFSAAVQRLEEIVKRLEQDEVDLEESSELFEEGIELAKFCSDRLHETEKKIERLTKDSTGRISVGSGENIDE